MNGLVNKHSLLLSYSYIETDEKYFKQRFLTFFKQKALVDNLK